jgi:hypothetical protein
VNHAQLQAEIVALAHDLGLHCHHCPMLTSSPGFPDLIIIGDRGVLWRELKVPPDEPTGKQRALGYRLHAAGQDWALWTPDHWWSGQVDRELCDIGGRWPFGG